MHHARSSDDDDDDDRKVRLASINKGTTHASCTPALSLRPDRCRPHHHVAAFHLPPSPDPPYLNVDATPQAVFGRYRHVLEKRGEAALGAAMSVWKEYLVAILRALDEMPGEAEVERPLVVSKGSRLVQGYYCKSVCGCSSIIHSLRVLQIRSIQVRAVC